VPRQPRRYTELHLTEKRSVVPGKQPRVTENGMPLPRARHIEKRNKVWIDNYSAFLSNIKFCDCIFQSRKNLDFYYFQLKKM
jgi:hypothetical protein